MVDDKATLPIQNINRQFTAMGNQFTTIQGKVNSFNSAINTNSKTFTASANAIKTQGNALTSLQTNLAANSTQATTLGGKIKATTSQFAGFATGLAVTTSGALQLAAGFRDYNDAQIAVERVTRKLSLATEAQGKAQDKLKALQAKGITSGKEYAQAQLDVSQANAAVSIQTQLLGESQERLFDSQSQFVASVIPVTLGALGSLGSAFRDLGGTKGFGGLVDKFKGLGGLLSGLGGKFSGLGTAVSGIIPSLTGIGSKAGDAIKGILGIGAASTTASFGVGGLKAALSGMALSLGALIGIPLGGIFAANALGNTFHEFHDIGDQVRKGQLDLAKSFGLTDAQVKQLNDSMNNINRLFGIYEPNVKKAAVTTTDLSKAEAKLSADEAKLLSLQKERQTTGVKQQEAELKITIDQDKAEIARLKTIANTTSAITTLGERSGGYFDDIQNAGPSVVALNKQTAELNIAFQSGFTTLHDGDAVYAGFGATVEDLTKKFAALSAAAKKPIKFPTPVANLVSQVPGPFAGNPTAVTNKTDLPEIKARIKAIEDEEQAILELGQKYGLTSAEFAKFLKNGVDNTAMMNQMVGLAVDYTEALTDQDKAQKLISLGFRDGRIQAKDFFDNLVRSTDQETSFTVSLAEGASELGIHSSLLAFSSGKMQELIKDTYEQTAAYDALQMSTASSTKWLKDQTLILSQVNTGMVDGTIAANDWAISNIKATAQGFAFHDQLVKITADMLGLPIPINASDEALKKAQTTFNETLDAGLALAEMMTDKLAPSFDRVSSIIQSKDMKELRDNLKKLELPKGFNKDLDDAFKPLRGAAEEARQLGNAMDILVTAGVNMSKKDLAGNMKAFGNELDRISKIKGTSKPVDAILMSLKTMSPEELGQHTDSIQFLVDTINKFGSLPKDKAKEFIDMYNKETPKMGPSSDTAAAGIDKLTLALSGFNKVTNKATVNGKPVQAFSIDPTFVKNPKEQQTTITADNSQALKAVDVIAKRIQSLSSIKAIISLVNQQAVKAVDVIAKRINDLTGIKPSISLVNKQAIKTVDVVAKRINDLTSIKPQISLQNKQAIKSVDVVAKRINDLEKIKPSISLNNKNAIKAVDVVANRIQDLSNIKATVHVGLSGPGASLASKGDTSIASKGDTSGIFVGGSKSDSGAGGDTIINVHVMDETIMRRITARSGRGRFTMGA